MYIIPRFDEKNNARLCLHMLTATSLKTHVNLNHKIRNLKSIL